MKIHDNDDASPSPSLTSRCSQDLMVANSHDNITGGLLFVISDQLRCASPFVAEAQEEANEKCLACSLSFSLASSFSA